MPDWPNISLLQAHQTGIMVRTRVEFPFMLELRNHPLINANFLQAWPPPWVSSMNGEYKSASGEIGVLKAVWMSAKSQQTIFLAIIHNGQRYVGCMALADVTFCNQLYGVLQSHIGRTIREIGDLDLSYTL